MGNLISLSTFKPVVIPDLKIGQLVKYTGDIANVSGVGAVMAIRNSSYGKSYDVALADGREWLASMMQADRWIISNQFAEPHYMDFLRAAVAAKKATDTANETAAAQSFAKAVERIKSENPHLIVGSGCVVAAKNIRAELKRAFPGIKFSVRTSRYSGGNSIDVEWTDGPNSDQVDKIISKYEYGHFDGMTDCYNNSDSPWNCTFGSTKYAHTRRQYSDAMVESRIRYVVDHLGGIDTPPTVADYRQGKVWNVRNSGGCDVGRELNAALAKHTYCIGK